MQIKQFLTPNQSGRGGYKPCLIVWHIAEGTYNGTIAWEQNPKSQTSSHFVLGKNGEVAQLVPLTEAAWTQGVVKSPSHPVVKMRKGVNPNLYCISIECEGFWKDTKGKLTDKALDSAAELTKHIVAEVKRIYGVEIPIDREHIIGHYQINSVTRPHCPGELFQFDELISRANDKKPVDKLPEHPLPYTVQVGSFVSAQSAQSLADKLKERGYFVQLHHGNPVRVCVGRFGSRGEAQRTAEDLKGKGFAGFVVML